MVCILNVIFKNKKQEEESLKRLKDSFQTEPNISIDAF